MKVHNLKDYKGGWFVGDFTPAILSSKEVEVSIKIYNKGDTAQSHFHKEAVELTVIVTGKALMNDKIIKAGDIVVLEKSEIMHKFECLEDKTITCIVKSPSVMGDKYLT